MAIFKKFNGIKQQTSGYTSGEDNIGLLINPSDGDIWINSQPYDSDSLYPIFDKKCKAFTKNASLNLVGHGFTRTQMIAKAPCLQNGQNTGNSLTQWKAQYQQEERDCNLEDDKTMTSSSRLFHFQSISNKDFYFYCSRSEGTYYETSGSYYFIEGNDFSNPDSVTYGQMQAATNVYYPGAYAPIYVDTANKYIYFNADYSPSNSGSYQYRSRVKGIARCSYTTIEDDGTLSISAPTFILLANSVGTYGTYQQTEANNFYYCGKNNDNTLMFFEFHQTSDNFATQTIATKSSILLNVESYDPTNGNVSTVAALTTSNLTDGSVSGQVMHRARPTSCVNSPISGEDNIYYSYYPVCDSSGNVSFILVNWDKSGNSNAGSVTISNCSVTYSTGVVTDYLEYPALTDNTIGVQTKSNSFITESNGEYYLHYLPSYGSPQHIATQNAAAKNLVTYSINNTDFTQLTYHSSIQVNSLDFVHLNTSRTKIAVIKPGELGIYTWNNGWSLTASESGSFTGVTQDSNGRIIGLSANADNTTVPALVNDYSLIEHKVHLISDSLPNTVTLSFADSSLTYSGSNLSTSINVSAYDDASTRVAKSVELKIDGSNAQFTANSSTSLTQTTLTSGDLNVPITITGPGPVAISAAFSI